MITDMSDKLFPGVTYVRRKPVRANFCPHTIDKILPQALVVGTMTICIECLFEKLQEVMYTSSSSIMMWCRTCQQNRQTEDGVCLSCGSKVE